MTEVEFEKLGDERAKADETDEGGDRRENIENIDLVRGESEIFSNRVGLKRPCSGWRKIKKKFFAQF